MKPSNKYSWLALGLGGLALASLLEAAPDTQVVVLRFGPNGLRGASITCSGGGYQSGAAWQFEPEHEPRQVEHTFQAAAGEFVCDVELRSPSTHHTFARVVAIEGRPVTLPVEHEIRALGSR